MKLIRFFLAVVVLVFSSQSMALFMPAGFQLNSGATAAVNDSGC